MFLLDIFFCRPPSHTPRLLINREKAGQRTGIMAMMGVMGGLEFDRKGNTRDVAWLGDCDDGCQLLADKLGWGVSYECLFSLVGVDIGFLLFIIICHITILHYRVQWRAVC